MLCFYNNFLSQSNELLVDLEEMRGFTLIPKCGSQSLRYLSTINPNRYRIYNSEAVSAMQISDIQVFVRNPIKRYISGLIQQTKQFGVSLETFDRLINQQQLVYIWDAHTAPQFWFLLKFGLKNNLRFHIVDLNEMRNFIPNVEHLNQTDNKNFILTDDALSRITHFFTEDIVLVNQYLNKVATITDIVQSIKKEVNFVNDINRYLDLITYLSTD